MVRRAERAGADSVVEKTHAGDGKGLARRPPKREDDNFEKNEIYPNRKRTLTSEVSVFVMDYIDTETNNGEIGHLDIAIKVVLKIPLAALPTEKMEY